MHQQNFPVFLTAVLGLSVLAVAIFVLTAGAQDTDPGEAPDDR